MAVLRQTLWLIFILLVLCLGGLLGLRYHDGFRDFVLLQILEPYGVSALQTRIESLGFSQASLSLLTADYEKDGVLLTAEVQQLQLQRMDNRLPLADPRAWSVSAEASTFSVQIDQDVRSPESTTEQASFDPATLLPQSLLRQVPLHSLNLSKLDANYQAISGESWHLEGSLDASQEQITSRFRLHHQDQAFRGELLLNQETVELALGDQNLMEKNEYWIRLQSRLNLVDERLVGGGTLSVSNLEHTEDWLALLPVNLPETDNWQGSINLAFTFGLPEARLQSWLADDTMELTGLMLTAQVQHDIALGLRSAELQTVAAKGSATVQVDADKLHIQPWQLEHISLTMMLTDPKTRESAAMLLGDTDTVSMFGSGEFRVSTGFDLSDIDIGSEKGSLRLQVPGSKRKAVNQMTLNKLVLSIREQQIHSGAVKGKFTVTLPEKPSLKGVADLEAGRTEKGNLKGKATLLLEDLTQFRVGYTYRPKQQTLDFTLDSEQTNLATNTFNEWAQKLALPFSLELGDFSMAMEGQVNLNDLSNLTTKGKVLVSDWHGNLEKNHFESLTSPFAFSGNLDHFSVQGTVSNALFDVGIPITDIRYNIGIESDLPREHFQVKVSSLESRLVGGLVRIPEFVWDNKVQKSQFNVVIFNWQFAQIIELLQRDDLEVTGILDGMLPIHVSEQGWEIREGRLTARKPGGVIRYKPEPSMKAYLSNQKQLKMAVDVLENFQYQTLDAVVNQELDGTQYINLTLKGKNPDAYGGTPVNLNLNIEHNINPLMQSLTLPGEIQENWNNLDTIKQ